MSEEFKYIYLGERDSVTEEFLFEQGFKHYLVYKGVRTDTMANYTIPYRVDHWPGFTFHPQDTVKSELVVDSCLLSRPCLDSMIDGRWWHYKKSSDHFSYREKKIVKGRLHGVYTFWYQGEISTYKHYEYGFKTGTHFDKDFNGELSMVFIYSGELTNYDSLLEFISYGEGKSIFRYYHKHSRVELAFHENGRIMTFTEYKKRDTFTTFHYAEDGLLIGTRVVIDGKLISDDVNE